ncbi:recombinase RecT [Clostridium botulinum]|uniref:recombinase RecT n=1 Tax=Clostridium botulinum TaxID=1491 RepID=UPI0021481FE1|nr:RecT family recombinase [Clostridium botulinum]MCR1166765.1 recombinase RecT [Clostridium botulinum]
MANTKAVLLQETANNLNTLLAAKAKALPKGFNKTRFLQNCMSVLQDTRDIEKCTSTTIARTMLKGAFLGLDFFNKECYAIPYGNKLNFQSDYKGEIKLAKKYSINPIKDIYAKVVREEDEFTEEIINGQQTINFKPKSFNNNEIIGTFAVCLFKDGSMIYETMSKEDIENVRQNFSKAKNSAAWTKTYGEMCKKTVLRRLCKLIELDFDSIEQQKTYEETSDFEVKKDEEVKEETSPFEDVDFEEVKEDEETQQE